MTSSVEVICRKFRRLKSKYVDDFAQHHASRTFVRDTDARHASRTFLCTVPQPLPSRDTHLCTSLPSPATRATYRRAKRIAHDLALYYALPSRATASRTTLRIARDIALPLRDIITHSADFTRTPTETWKEARRRSMTAYQIRKSTTNTSSESVLECTRNTLRLVCKLAHVCATYYSFYRSR